jgi:hypothetical protein
MNNDLIDQCRFYRGEKICPDGFKDPQKWYLWFFESRWVEMYEANSEILENYIIEYTSMPGLSSFEDQDGTPTSLKALLFNRYAEGFWSMINAVPNFMEWYVKAYQGHKLNKELN